MAEGHCECFLDRKTGCYQWCCQDHENKYVAMLERDAMKSQVMKLWRECGLPEYFLGNGGTNDALLLFFENAKARGVDEERERCAKIAERFEKTTYGGKEVSYTVAELIRDGK